MEHVVPRCRRPDLAEDWTNFLVGCTSCNGIKRDRNQSRDGYLWPDEDDTRAAFEYLPDGIVQVQPDLSEHDRAQATNLLELVGLGRRPAANPRASDMRWRKRREALAAAVGFWSVWMTVFADLPRVCDQCHPTREDDGRGVTAGRSPRRC